MSTIQILRDVLTTMKHARTFISTREKMHPDGIALYDESIGQVEAALTAPSQAASAPVGYDDEVTAAQVEKIDALVKPEFASGDWREVESETIRLRGTLRYIAAQARANHPGVLQVILANAEAALNNESEGIRTLIAQTEGGKDAELVREARELVSFFDEALDEPNPYGEEDLGPVRAAREKAKRIADRLEALSAGEK